MRTLVLLVLVASAAVCVAAPVPKVVKRKTDLELLEGKWGIVTLDSGSGPRVPTGDVATFTLTVKEGKLSTATKSSPGYIALPIRIDDSQPPKHIDIEEVLGRFVECIYEIDGDTLKWCHPQPGQPRPTEFKGGNGNYCFVWKRVKE